MNTENQKAKILMEALPYIQKFHGKILVVKYGGAAMSSDEGFSSLIHELVLLRLIGISVVLVHGGGKEIDFFLQKMGKKPKFVNGLRFTDRETMEIVQSTLAGKINKTIVAMIESAGASAIGLCGADTGLLHGKKLASADLGYVGEIEAVHSESVVRFLKCGLIPVIAPIAFDFNEAISYNVNADTVAAELAISLNAEKLVLLTDTAGVLEQVDDEKSLLKTLTLEEMNQLKQEGKISGGMIPKLECCMKALAGGVKRAHILDGRCAYSLLIELLTAEGAGTMIY